MVPEPTTTSDERTRRRTIAPLLDALRDRLSLEFVLEYALGWVGMLSLFWLVFDYTVAQFAALTLMLGVLDLTRLAAETYGVRRSATHVGYGIVALVAAVALAPGAGDEAWVPAAFVVGGAWFLVDGIQTIRHEGALEPAGDGRRSEPAARGDRLTRFGSRVRSVPGRLARPLTLELERD